MARAGHEVEQLRAGQEEVEDLRDEQQHERLAEMAQDSDDGEHHAREVAVCVPNKHTRRVLVVPPERQRDRDEGDEVVCRRQVRVDRRVARAVFCQEPRDQVQRVVHEEQRRDDQGLQDLDPVNPSKHVDAVGAEYGHGGHVDVVNPAEIQGLAPEVCLEGKGEHDLGDAVVDKINDQNGA